MTIDDVLKYFTNPESKKSAIDNMASALSISRNNVCLWRKRGGIPYIQQLRLENISNGILKTDSTSLLPRYSKLKQK